MFLLLLIQHIVIFPLLIQPDLCMLYANECFSFTESAVPHSAVCQQPLRPPVPLLRQSLSTPSPGWPWPSRELSPRSPTMANVEWQHAFLSTTRAWWVCWETWNHMSKTTIATVQTSLWTSPQTWVWLCMMPTAWVELVQHVFFLRSWWNEVWVIFVGVTPTHSEKHIWLHLVTHSWGSGVHMWQSPWYNVLIDWV